MLLLILQRKKRAVKYAACLVAFAQNTIFTPLLKSRVTDRRNTFLPQKVKLHIQSAAEAASIPLLLARLLTSWRRSRLPLHYFRSTS